MSKKASRFSPLLLCLSLLVGCRGSINPVGTIGGWTVYSGKLPSAAGPSVNFVALQKTDQTNDLPIIIGVSAGNGISTAVLQVGGIVGAAAALRPSEVNTVNSTTTEQTKTTTPAPPVYGPQLPDRTPPYHWGPGK